MADAVRTRRPDLVIAATAFSAREDGIDFVLDGADCPVLQAFAVGAPQAAWAASARGLGAADLAMQVALPEFDGRLSGFPISFKEEAPEIAGFAERRAVPYGPGIDALAERAAGWLRLAAKPRPERRVAMVLSDYPARGGRAGFAVGLDTPESACAIAADLTAAGYAAGSLPQPAALMGRLTDGPAAFSVPLTAYTAWLGSLPEASRTALVEAWGEPEADVACVDGAFRFRMVVGSGAGPLSRAGEGQGEGRAASGNGSTDPHVDGVLDPERSRPSPQPSPARERGQVALAHQRECPPKMRDHRSPCAGEGGSRPLPTQSAPIGSPSPARWGERGADPTAQPEERSLRGALAVFLQPDRGRDADRKAGLPRSGAPPDPRLSGVPSGPAAALRCAGSARHPRHDGVAARQGGGAVARLPAGFVRRRPAGDLPVRRRRSGRGRPAETPPRRRGAGPPDAADDRARPLPGGGPPARAGGGICRRQCPRPAPRRDHRPRHPGGGRGGRAARGRRHRRGYADGRGSDAPRRPSVRPRRDHVSRWPARLRPRSR